VSGHATGPSVGDVTRLESMASPWSVEASPWAVLDTLDALERKYGANDRGKQCGHWHCIFPLLSRVRCPLLLRARPLIAHRRHWSGSHRPCLPTGREGRRSGGSCSLTGREGGSCSRAALLLILGYAALLCYSSQLFRCSLVRSSVDLGVNRE
jgi:hypothetical protein